MANYPSIYSRVKDFQSDPPIAIRIICERHDVSLHDLLGKRRFRHLVLARVDAYAKLREMGWSYPAIGWLFNRHHSSIIIVLSGKHRHGTYTRRQKETLLKDIGSLDQPGQVPKGS